MALHEHLSRAAAGLTEARVLIFGSSAAAWNWLTAGMNGINIISAVVMLALGLVKLYQALARERDKRMFKRAFEAAEQAGDDQLRAAVVEAHDRAFSEPGRLGPR